jgi:hypothetical protein
MDYFYTALKYTAIALVFGAYHYYSMNTQWKQQQEIYKIQEQTYKELIIYFYKELNKKT